MHFYKKKMQAIFCKIILFPKYVIKRTAHWFKNIPKCYELYWGSGSINISSFLKPQIMEVGGSSDWPQNSIDDSLTWGNIKSRRIFHPTLNQLTLWPLESWILPQNTQKYDEIWQGPFNFFKHIWLILYHKWPEFS